MIVDQPEEWKVGSDMAEYRIAAAIDDDDAEQPQLEQAV